MEIPKTLWLKTHMDPERFKNCMFFDLPDYCAFPATFSCLCSLADRASLTFAVTYRATQHQARSANSLVCKFSYIPTDAHESAGNHPKSEGWNAEFLKQVGLGELVDRGLGQIGGQTGKKLSIKEGSDEGEALVLSVRLFRPSNCQPTD